MSLKSEQLSNANRSAPFMNGCNSDNYFRRIKFIEYDLRYYIINTQIFVMVTFFTDRSVLPYCKSCLLTSLVHIGLGRVICCCFKIVKFLCNI